MTVTEAEKKTNPAAEKRLFLEYPWFYDNIYGSLENILKDFFNLEYNIRFMGISYNDENVLFYGDEYFVNKIPINKTASAIVRISSNLISVLLDDSLGESDNEFSLDTLTDIEAMLIKSLTLYMYNKIEGLLVKSEPNKKTVKTSKIYNFTFYVENNDKHIGKIIISIPDYTINEKIEIEEPEECFDISSFDGTPVMVCLRVGSAKIPLNDIKNIEDGDVIVLDNSDVDKMALLWNGNIVDFNITPNPALIISVDKTGGDEMSDNSEINSENMWDTILVDVVAEFDNFKMTLGELKQISEGLVIDIGSVYKNKVKLRVAKQVVASGELVILNDRYGVRIDSVKNNDNDNAEDEEYYEDSENEEQETDETDLTNDNEQTGNDDNESADENFDYSDFEIEDESI